MKIKAIVRFNEDERSFSIACGVGDKTFKWLGNVASQRYSTAIPNGNLRRREDFCGVTDHAQYQTMNIILPSGESPLPNELLSDHLHDEELVTVELCSKLSVDNHSCIPLHTSWTTMAYTASQERLQTMESMLYNSDDDSLSILSKDMYCPLKHSTVSFPQPNHKDVNPHEQSRANFMKVIVQSQCINQKKINEQLDHHWRIIDRSLKHLHPDDIPMILQTFTNNWDLLTDLYEFYTKDCNGLMDKERFYRFCEDANVFPIIALTRQTNLVFARTLHYYQPKLSSPNYFDFTCLLISLLLCSQLKYNDTLDPKLVTKRSNDAIDRLLFHNLLPLGRRINCPSLLRNAFLQTDVLLKLHDHYDIFQNTFDKLSTKLKDIPTTITCEDFSELMYNSSIQVRNVDVDRARVLLSEVRKGSIFGRDIDIHSAYDTVLANADEFPKTEFTFAEFLEALCRAGYYFFTKSNPFTTVENSSGGMDGEEAQKIDIVDLFVKSVISVSDFASGKKPKPQTVPARKTKK